ncbi:MAG: hypothetical protein ACHQRJ_17085 [Alphaproteobacteria bacterium]
MSIHRYPRAALRGDYLRAGIGLVLTGGLAALAGGQPVATGVLGGAALLFLAFALRTWLRQRTIIEIIDDGISTSGGRSVNLTWRDLSAFKLRYYATKRDRTGGWMQLTLAAGRKRLSLESSLDGFVEVTRRAALAATANGVRLDAPTRNNLLALGVAPPAEPA